MFRLLLVITIFAISCNHVMASLSSDNFFKYYDTLGANYTDELDIIKAKYHALALEYHPDKNKGNDKEQAEIKMQEINEAYEGIERHLKHSKPFSSSSVDIFSTLSRWYNTIPLEERQVFEAKCKAYFGSTMMVEDLPKVLSLTFIDDTFSRTITGLKGAVVSTLGLDNLYKGFFSGIKSVN